MRRLTIATFNTLSLGPSAEADDGSMRDTEGLAYRPGRAPLLAAQLQSHGIHAVCLQETRAEAGFTKVGGFLRYASGAVKGQWGTEWWFRSHYTLLQGVTGEASICFDERYFAVAHTDARRLFLRFVCRHVRLLFVGVHAPHRATEGCALEEWWLCTTRLVKQHGRDDFVILAGDCSAALGSVPTSHVRQLEAEQRMSPGNTCTPSCDMLTAVHPPLLLSAIGVPPTPTHRRGEAV